MVKTDSKATHSFLRNADCDYSTIEMQLIPIFGKIGIDQFCQFFQFCNYL